MGAHKGEVTKGHEETSGSNGFVHHLECGDSFLSVDSYRNLPKLYIFNKWSLLYVNYISIKLFLKNWNKKRIQDKLQILKTKMVQYRKTRISKRKTKGNNSKITYQKFKKKKNRKTLKIPTEKVLQIYWIYWPQIPNTKDVV